MKTVVDIRTYKTEDENALIELWDRCGLLRSWNDPARDIRRKLRVQTHMFLVGVQDQRVIASVMAGYDGHRGSVNYLAVDPDYRRRGYGRALMDHVADLLRDEGCPKINLLVRAENKDVIEFYKSLDFIPETVVNLGKRLIPDS